MAKFEITQRDVEAATHLYLINAGPTSCEVQQVLETLVVVGTKRYCGQLMDEGLTIDQINEKLRELDLAAWQQSALATIMEKVSASRTKLN
jgi:hypothetical protein